MGIIWKKFRLKDITTKIGSGATPRGGQRSYKLTGTPLIRSLNIYDLTFRYDDLSYIDDNQASQLSNVEVEKNDVLLNITGASVCRCTSVPDNLVPARVNQHVSIIRADSKNLDGRYLKYLLVSSYYKSSLLGLARAGATREALTKEKIEDFEITVPPFDIQSRIAAVFSAYDDLIENNEKRIRILEEIAQRLYTEWFVKFKFPGHEKTRMADSGTEYGIIPEGWEVRRLGDVIELAYGKALRADERIDGDVPVYGSSGHVGMHTEKLVSGPGIVVGRKGNVGSVFWVDRDFYPIDTTFYIKTSLSLYYVYYLLRSQKFVSGDAAVPGLNRSQAHMCKIIVPETTLLNRFSGKVKHWFGEINVLINQIHNLRKTRDFLIPQLVTGKRG